MKLYCLRKPERVKPEPSAIVVPFVSRPVTLLNMTAILLF